MCVLIETRTCGKKYTDHDLCRIPGTVWSSDVHLPCVGSIPTLFLVHPLPSALCLPLYVFPSTIPGNHFFEPYQLCRVGRDSTDRILA